MTEDQTTSAHGRPDARSAAQVFDPEMWGEILRLLPPDVPVPDGFGVEHDPFAPTRALDAARAGARERLAARGLLTDEPAPGAGALDARLVSALRLLGAGAGRVAARSWQGDRIALSQWGFDARGAVGLVRLQRAEHLDDPVLRRLDDALGVQLVTVELTGLVARLLTLLPPAMATAVRGAGQRVVRVPIDDLVMLGAAHRAAADVRSGVSPVDQEARAFALRVVEETAWPGGVPADVVSLVGDLQAQWQVEVTARSAAGTAVRTWRGQWSVVEGRLWLDGVGRPDEGSGTAVFEPADAGTVRAVLADVLVQIVEEWERGR